MIQRFLPADLDYATRAGAKPPADSTSMNPSSKLLPVAQATRPFYVGIDVGGTNTKIGLVDDRGRTLAYDMISTEAESGAEQAIEQMARVMDELVQRAGVERTDVAGVGLATPGVLDARRGMLLRPHNLPGWFDFPIRDRLAHHCGLPVTFTNDANAAAFGEFWIGSAQEADSMLLLTLGTGIGGGIIIDGRMLDGQHSLGGECGHIVIDMNPTARRCGCGGSGHLEAYASATALVEFAEEALSAGESTSVAARVAAGEALSPLLLAEEAEKGDVLSRRLILDAARYLAAGIATLIHVVDPNAVVLGGAMTFGRDTTQLGRDFLETVRQETIERLLYGLAENISIEYAGLGGDAGYIGAAGLARATRSNM